jgi:hypothetical protein
MPATHGAQPKPELESLLAMRTYCPSQLVHLEASAAE